MGYFMAKGNEYKDIDYADWLLLTPAEQEAGKYYIHGMPESKQKIVTDSGTFEDASQNTYTGVTTDMISYDATNNQLLLKVGGADSVIPFKRGGAESINPNLLTSGNAFKISSGYNLAIPVSGYSTLKLYQTGTTNNTTAYTFDASGTQISSSSLKLTQNTWVDFTVPSGIVTVRLVLQTNIALNAYFALIP